MIIGVRADMPVLQFLAATFPQFGQEGNCRNSFPCRDTRFSNQYVELLSSNSLLQHKDLEVWMKQSQATAGSRAAFHVGQPPSQLHQVGKVTNQLRWFGSCHPCFDLSFTKKSKKKTKQQHTTKQKPFLPRKVPYFCIEDCEELLKSKLWDFGDL
ncbi:hypothetical protein EK904_012436 [Melospiza melodia maxima]|nr:hypothetical protein EK904_012436 [Melospiza melodia maxima]